MEKILKLFSRGLCVRQALCKNDEYNHMATARNVLGHDYIVPSCTVMRSILKLS